ncbi:DNA-3-methyladenine glycosylase family protein [Candidatus Poriferisocius sp.]|uniref:DNA-3-methyladenine glycosylase family protein n=1 Tax=Candidatus Poriferisocius sp. TaxID=3101276 RepID=UPI003B02DA08
MGNVGLTEASRALSNASEVMAGLVQRFGPARFGPKPTVEQRFEVLSREIAYQQLAGKAAGAIWGRVRGQMPEWAPGAVLALGEAPLRSAGLSGAKTRAMLDLAAHCEQGTLDLARLGRLSDQEVIDQLTQVWGIGTWTAQMFLIFSLRRLDVWPVGDFGVRKGYGLAHGWTEPPTAEELEPLGDPFRPYRSVAAWYCWRATEV